MPYLTYAWQQSPMHPAYTDKTHYGLRLVCQQSNDLYVLSTPNLSWLHAHNSIVATSREPTGASLTESKLWVKVRRGFTAIFWIYYEESSFIPVQYGYTGHS